ncbi:hypothetical protein OSTOST_10799, partial [Ostertagia ostertagi]
MSKSCNALRSTLTALRQIRNMSNFTPASRVQGAKPSIWVEFTTLARECEAVNLGQGFPNEPVPQFVTDSLGHVAAHPEQFSWHQYTQVELF